MHGQQNVNIWHASVNVRDKNQFNSQRSLSKVTFITVLKRNLNALLKYIAYIF
jgi:hypothetical protein